MIKTKILNMWGGPGSGKSTLAAAVYAELKARGLHTELVREYVKAWAYRGEKISQWDQLYIYGKQLRAQSYLYGKVEYIVTDCPLGINVVYESYYLPGKTLLAEANREITRQQAEAGVTSIDFMTNRTYSYVPEGRNETEAQAREVDTLCRSFLTAASGGYHAVSNAGQVLEYIL